MNVQIPYKTVKMLLEVLDKIDWESDYIRSGQPDYLENEYQQMYEIHNLLNFEHYTSIEIDDEIYSSFVALYKELKPLQW